jgi:hypothetical protein
MAAPEPIRDGLMRDAVKPYLQRATEERDTHTNIRLIDIWRYCRYTWSLPASSQPGRQMHYLVRDASRDFHPVIGIGALGSSVVQITCRDEAIGWNLASLREAPDRVHRLRVLETELEHALDEILWNDLLSADEVSSPSQQVLDRLTMVASAERPVNRSAEPIKETDLLEDALSPSFVRKRATELHRILKARVTFQKASNETQSDEDRIEWLLEREDGRQALAAVLRSVKKRHIGSSIMDITVCGAIPPYSELLAGKLVALLMASPQVIVDYRNRYKQAISEIASRMAGRELVRPADLVLLGTTSLYFIGSSQYNRLQFPAARGNLKYHLVGKTKGFGSVHLSQRTYKTLQELLRQHPDLEPESHAFAAGVNFKMRSIASGLAHVGLDQLQQHESPRLVYLVPLASNWQDYLTGIAEKPEYLYADLEHPEAETQKIIEYWKDRWFIPRQKRPETIYRLRTAPVAVRVSALADEPFPAQMNEGTADRVTISTNNGGGESRMAAAATIAWQTLAELKDQRASLAEQLTDSELLALHVPMKLDGGLLAEVAAGRRLYLTGNPGDGKTHIIRRYQEELERHNAFVHTDASALDEGLLLSGLGEAIQAERPAVIAINEGPLRRLVDKLPVEEQRLLRTQLDHPFLYRDVEENGDVAETQALLVNLGARRLLTPALIGSVLDVVLNRVDYSGAPDAVRQNQTMLSRPRVQERLLKLLEFAARGGAHVTMHELLGFFSFIITEGQTRIEAASAIPAYYDLVFSDSNPLSRWLLEFDPVVVSHPLVDMRLWDGDPSSDIERLDGGSLQAPGSESDHDRGLSLFRSLKRRFYFESRDGELLLTMIPEDRQTFYDLLRESGSARDTAKSRLLSALAQFFGSDADSQEDQLPIWTSLRYEAIAPATAFLSSQGVTADRVELMVPRLRPQVARLLEYEPSWVRLVVNPALETAPSIGLNIDLELWLALMKLRRGMPQRHHDPVIGRRLNQFMSRLAVQHEQTAGGYVRLHIRDVESGETFRINVSVEQRKYVW